MACGISVKNALNDCDALASLKWPNDIIVNGKKIGGILCESKIREGKSKNIVIGIGLNVNQDNTDIHDLNIVKASSLKNEYNKTFKRENIIAAIVNSLENLLIHFPENKNKIIREWERSCVHLNKTVELSVKSEKVKGIFIKLNDNGCGVIKVNGKLINVSSATMS